MSKALEEKVNELFEATKDLKSFEEIQPFCDEFNAWVAEQNFATSTLGTKLSKVGFFKKFKSITPLVPEENAVVVDKHDGNGNIIGSEIKHYVLTVCGLSKEQWAARNETDRVTTRLTSTEGKEIIPDDYCSKVGELLESKDPFKLAIGLIAATGRRPCEIFSAGSFKKTDNPYKALFTGQLKKRGKSVPYEIFTLFPTDYIIKQKQRLVKSPRIRTFLKEIAQKYSEEARRNEAIDNSLNRQAREVIKGLFDKEYLPVREGDEDYNNKALRAACAALIVHRDYPGSIGSKMLAFGKFLGHIEPTEKPSDKELNNLVTSLGYSDYYVEQAVPYPAAPEKEKTHIVRVFEDDLEAIKLLQEKFKLENQQLVLRKLIDSFKNATAELLTAREALSKAQFENHKLKQELTEMPTNNIDETELNNRISQIVDEKLSKFLDQLETKLETKTKDIIEDINENTVENKVEASVKNKIPARVKTTPIKPAVNTEENLQDVKDEILWSSKGNGTANEKLRRCLLAITSYNDSVCEDKLAITNQALRQLSKVNGLNVRDFLNKHSDEVISHNQKHGMANSKEPEKLETYYNKRYGQEKIEKILEEIAKKAGIPIKVTKPAAPKST